MSFLGVTKASARWRFQHSSPWLLLLIFLLGWVPRSWAWYSPSLHPDEALYAYWGRLIASGRDLFLLAVYVDKPPLHLYLVALAFKVLGGGLWVVRLPSLFASFATLPIFYSILRPVYGMQTALWAMMLLALSPYPIVFAPTVFADSLLLFWGLLACAFAVRKQWFRIGIILSLAIATKQQGFIFIPLTFTLVWIMRRECPIKQEALLRSACRLLLGFSIPFALVVWWDSLRWHNRPSLWDRSWQTYGGIRLAPLDAWPARVAEWVEWLRYLTASPWLSLLLVVSVAVLTAGLFRRRDLRSQVDGLIIIFSLIYLVLHWWFTFGIWDRYVLLLAPWAALLLARGALGLKATLVRRWSWSGPFMGMLLLAMALPPAWMAAERRLPIGGEATAYAGMTEAATWIAQNLPEDALLYHHELGWHLDYELFGSGPPTRWFEDGAALTKDLAEQRSAAYLIMPDWSPLLREVIETLAEQGRTLVPRYDVGVIRIYAIASEPDL